MAPLLDVPPQVKAMKQIFKLLLMPLLLLLQLLSLPPSELEELLPVPLCHLYQLLSAY